jgi:carbonic anhydrase
MKAVNYRVIGVLACLLGACTLALAGQPTADEAEQQLVQGNQRYVADQARHPNTDAARRQQTAASGQHPFVTVVACSDSRVPVERIFDQGVGDIFVIRVAGNVCDTNELASIEYGVGHLHTPLLVILGHSKCGAVTAVVQGAEVHGHIPRLLTDVRHAVAEARKESPSAEGEELLDKAIRANVWHSVERALTHSHEVHSLVKEGKLRVVGAMYDIASGKVEWLGPHPQQDDLLAKPAHRRPAKATSPGEG